MTLIKKIIIASLVITVITSVSVYTLAVRDRDVVTVEIGIVSSQGLVQSVTANGEIKPKSYVNISSNSMGRIVDLPVVEGDEVDEGQLLLQIESIQTEAEVLSAQASLSAAAAELEGMEASIRSAKALLGSAQADERRAQADFRRGDQEFKRAQELLENGLVSREEFERHEATFEVAVAQLDAAKARILQSQAQLTQTSKQQEGLILRMGQQRAALTRARDQLDKTKIRSPLAGVITYLPVNEGEIAIVGLQNQPGTTLMTIADMSVITAEVRVDETDIVNLKLGQTAAVRVDALGDRKLAGYVSEIGNTALTSSGGGLTNTTSASGEARDFRVVITLDNPPPELRPGLSCTATIETAVRNKTLTVPIQALAIREIDEVAVPDFIKDAVPVSSRFDEQRKVEQEGVFVVDNGIATFRPVRTGIIGTTDIEILDGLNASEEIVVGSYRVLRTLKDQTRIKVEEENSGLWFRLKIG